MALLEKTEDKNYNDIQSVLKVINEFYYGITSE